MLVLDRPRLGGFRLQRSTKLTDLLAPAFSTLQLGGQIGGLLPDAVELVLGGIDCFGLRDQLARPRP